MKDSFNKAFFIVCCLGVLVGAILPLTLGLLGIILSPIVGYLLGFFGIPYIQKKLDELSKL